jgi:hypothetical protein
MLFTNSSIRKIKISSSTNGVITNNTLDPLVSRHMVTPAYLVQRMLDLAESLNSWKKHF